MIKSTLLIVDDEPINLSVLSQILSEKYLVRVANSGIRALEVAASHPEPDLILLDVMMPQMDGYEVLQHLKDNPLTSNIPVIFVTAMEATLDQITEAYNRKPEPGTWANGSEETFREVRLDAWPSHLHYEFTSRPHGFNLELLYQDPANEDDFPLFAAAKVIAEKLFPGLDVRVIHNRTQKVAVRVKLPDYVGTDLVADHMRQFIRGTRETAGWACGPRLAEIW